MNQLETEKMCQIINGYLDGCSCIQIKSGKWVNLNPTCGVKLNRKNESNQKWRVES